jgi:2-phosphosulfolactate phosphatase
MDERAGVSAFLHMDHAKAEAFENHVAVVVDCIRATTVICTAIAAGASSIIPCLTIEDAWVAAKSEPVKPLMGGERGGELIEGFDLDNSPHAYTPDVVRGRTIVFTTANGSAALLHARRAQRVFVGAMVNAKAVGEKLSAIDAPIRILCSGTRGDIGLDDCLAAGAIIQELTERGRALAWDDASRLCLTLYRWSRERTGGHVATLMESRGVRSMLPSASGWKDIEACAKESTLDVVPEFNVQSGKVTAA